LYEPGSTKGLLLIKNNKGALAADVCKNQTVKNIVLAETQIYEGREMKRRALMAKMKKAGIKAKIIGANAREAYWKIRAQQQRYGAVRKENAHNDEEKEKGAGWVDGK
jgi:hypothetical protein